MAPSQLTSFYLLTLLYLSLFPLSVSRLSPQALTLRCISSILLLFTAYLMLRCSYYFNINPLTQSSFSGVLNIHCASLCEMLLVSRYGPEDLTHLAKRGSGSKLWEAVCLSFNLRRVGTRCQIMPLRQQTVRTRGRFLAVYVPGVLLCLLLIDLIVRQPPPDPSLILPEKETVFRLWTLSLEDVGFRTGLTVAYWLTTYLVKSTMMYSVAVVGITLGISDPKAWPPVNGPVSSAYTVRKFWGTFWHQAFRKTITGFGDFITDSVLCIPRKTLASRYVRLVAAFAISGVLHQNMQLALGMHKTQAPAFVFFVVQSVGIMLEDGVQALLRGVALPPKMARGIGYVWVFAFLWLTTPTWAYPGLRLDLPPMVLAISPLDFVSKLVSWRW